MIIKIIFTILGGIIVFIITEINIRKILINKRRQKTLLKNYIPSEEIVYGAKDYDFFDHDECGYIDEMITLKKNNPTKATISYQFDKSFIENCKTIEKLAKIKETINDQYNIQNIDAIVRDEIVPHIPQNENQTIWSINNIIKTRKDYKDRKEASYLEIELVRMDIKTVLLIDRLYVYLRQLNPNPLEIHFKTNKHVYTGLKLDKKDSNYNLDNDIRNICCFMTKLNLKGFILTKSDYKLHYNNEDYYSYNFLVTKEILNSDNVTQHNIDGGVLKTIINSKLEQNTYNKKLEFKFTDVCISYHDGIHIELFGVIITDKLTFSNNTISIPFEYDYLKEKLKANITSQEENAISYALSLVAKAKNKRFESIHLEH